MILVRVNGSKLCSHLVDSIDDGKVVRDLRESLILSFFGVITQLPLDVKYSHEDLLLKGCIEFARNASELGKALFVRNEANNVLNHTGVKLLKYTDLAETESIYATTFEVLNVCNIVGEESLFERQRDYVYLLQNQIIEFIHMVEQHWSLPCL